MFFGIYFIVSAVKILNKIRNPNVYKVKIKCLGGILTALLH